MKELKNNIFYCGLNDENRPLFDELIPLEHGTTYNSYYIKGSEKTALIDTMYPPKIEEYISNLQKDGVNKVDYIIANHGEQDHTGALPALIKLYPEAKIVTNAICKNNIMSMLFIPEDKIRVVKTGEELSLGDKTLRFITAPGVHWPDTMFTYAVEDNVLFTCDFLGAHKIFENPIANCDEDLKSAAKRYYAEIMMPFRSFCQKYTKMIKEMNVDMIMPSHGPVYDNPDFILDLYTDWASDESKNMVVLPYVSMYGSTLEMVNYVGEKLKSAGIEVVKFDIVNGDLGEYAMTLVDAKTIIIGSPMVLMGPHPNAMNAASLTAVLNPKAKYLSVIGSFGWGGKLVEKLTEPFANSKIEMLDPVLVKGKAKEPDFTKLDELVNSITERHRG
ncbi:FprA family A-type flavoprotein [bacterium]|nr:FprA family A-type flavoprotein [bacterium]